MIKTEFLKKLNVLYVEDDPLVRESLEDTLKKVLNKVHVACDGHEAIKIHKDLKKRKERLDVIVSDINMPKIDGIKLLHYVREMDKSLPFIFTTAHSEVDYLLKAVELDATDYLLKPIEVTELLEKIETACHNYHQIDMIKKQKKELERYLKAIDNVAIISKTDLKGRIIFANQIFCDIAQYTREELYGQSHSLVRHPDMPSKAFKELWQTIKSGHTWQGKVKNRAKDGSAYYVHATIIPLMDEFNQDVIEYIGIRFLTTDDELEKREFKKKVMLNLQDTKKKQLEDAKQIELLEKRLQNYANVGHIENALTNERKKSTLLNNQVKHYENEIKEVKAKKETLVSLANTKVKKASKVAVQLKSTNDKLALEKSVLKDELEENKKMAEELQNRVEAQVKTIRDLRDVIEHREQQLEAMQTSS